VKSIRRFGRYPAGRPLLADDILEFHAGRLLLLLRICGTANRITGLTKLAKLDFFVRYPKFFERVVGRATVDDEGSVESVMTRHHYGPWDQRYYHVLAFLEGSGLITVGPEGRAIKLELTSEGAALADRLKINDAFVNLTDQMRLVKKEFGSKTGSALKKLIYQTFAREVGRKELGEEIK
jgi:hypothetical protein